jgi:hypothetical protein
MGLLSNAGLARAIRATTNRGIATGASIAGALAGLLILLTGFEISDRIIASPPGASPASGLGY